MADPSSKGGPRSPAAGKTGGGGVIPLKRRRCPTCGHPTAARFRPFCSRRCADIDLGRWLRGEYRIASDDEGKADDEAPGPDRS